MEQLYLIEMFIDKVSVYVSEQDEDSGAQKGLITKISFGPNAQYVIKELTKNDKAADDIITCDEQGKKKWTRTVRIGKSFLFTSFPDTVLSILSKFPLEIEMWNDDESEEDPIFVGVGYINWDKKFFEILKESIDPKKIHQPLSVKQMALLWQECCCKPAAEVEFILRVSALGESIITEFQQPLHEPDAFVFRSNKSPSMFYCKRLEGDDPNFCMLGCLYESTTLEDPDIIQKAHKKIEVCTELLSCGMGTEGNDYRCTQQEKKNMKEYAIDKIKMGEISGPCGNVNCPLAHRVRKYIRSLDNYKAKAQGITGTKDTKKNICGTCPCKDERHHRADCPSKKPDESPECGECCGGGNRKRPSCKEKEVKIMTNKKAETVAYVFSVHTVPDFKESMFERDFSCQTLNATYNNYLTAGPVSVKSDAQCCYRAVKLSTQDTKQDLEFNPYLKSGISSHVKIGNECCCSSMPSMEASRGAELFNSASSPNLGSSECSASTRSIKFMPDDA